MLLKERSGVYKGNAKVKNFLSFDLDIEANISSNGDITVNTLAPIVGKISHTISLGADYDKDDYSMNFEKVNFDIKFNSDKSIDIMLPEKINGSIILTRNITLNRV
ncbi:hypothetical protein [uncultured Brachyspira sp.]|uniref:hypothetical protein n=1 Tax=uncultured Brachyspira sp. TaxID=221953 RepID=UPI0026263A49|nr:hypothetical protein [uncultured Brachyspira sp.]